MRRIGGRSASKEGREEPCREQEEKAEEEAVEEMGLGEDEEHQSPCSMREGARGRRRRGRRQHRREMERRAAEQRWSAQAENAETRGQRHDAQSGSRSWLGVG